LHHSFRSILKELDVVVILGALLLVAAIFKASTFYNLSNLFTILELSAVLGIATLGEAMVLIVRGVDVSVGAVMGLAGTLSAFLIPDFGLTVSIIVPLVVCGLIGLGNGLLVEKGRVPHRRDHRDDVGGERLGRRRQQRAPHPDPR
jgi:ribose/xylose/arabinose/galactoside ABC-type transport system permease subunit